MELSAGASGLAGVTVGVVICCCTWGVEICEWAEIVASMGNEELAEVLSTWSGMLRYERSTIFSLKSSFKFPGTYHCDKKWK